jgi:hypothetical protein
MQILAFWLPILVSAVVLFFASAAIWMAFKWHDSDFRKAGNEDAVRAALSGSAPGVLMLPYCKDPEELKDPDLQKKYIDGPQAYITVVPNGLPTMGGKFLRTIAYYIFVGALCAYFLVMTGSQDAEYLVIFRITCTVAWIAYGIAYIQDSIWFGRPWSITIKNLLDALIYGLLTGGVFGWLA